MGIGTPELIIIVGVIVLIVVAIVIKRVIVWLARDKSQTAAGPPGSTPNDPNSSPNQRN
jgi:hypothetical protein